MQKLILALIGCVISVAAFTQTKCKYDHDKYDDMERRRVVWNEIKVGGGVGSKWWFKVANYGSIKVLKLTVRLGTKKGIVVGKQDALKLKFTGTDSVFNAYTNEITTSSLFMGAASEITVTYFLDAATIDKLSTANLDKIRFTYNSEYLDASIKKGEAEKIQKSANCVYQQL